MTGLGVETSDKIKVNISADHAVTLLSSVLPITDLGSTFANGIYTFKYQYVKGGKTFRVDETLKQRNDPENDLRFEEW